MKILCVFIVFIVMICHLATAQQDTGSICVAARVDDPFWRQPATLPDGKINSHGLRVKIDKKPAVAWPDRKGLKIDGLNTSEHHVLVVLDSEGKPVESIRFSFSQYKSPDLCVSYDGYQGIGLQELGRRTPWCKCR